MHDPKQPKDPQEDREPLRRDVVGAEDETETEEEELVYEDYMVKFSEDDLEAMEGPDA